MKKAGVYETPTTTQEDDLIIPKLSVFVVSDEDSLPFAFRAESDFQSPIERRTNTSSADPFEWMLQEVRKEFGTEISLTVYADRTPRMLDAPTSREFHSCEFRRIADEANPAGSLLSESWFW